MTGPVSIEVEQARTAAALHALARAVQRSVVSHNPGGVSVYGQDLLEADQRALVEGIQPGTVEPSGSNRLLFCGVLLSRLLVRVYLPAAAGGVGAELAAQLRAAAADARQR